MGLYDQEGCKQQELHSCKELDEDEHFYDWRGAGAHFVGCDYVEMNSDLVLCGIILEERRCTFRSG